MKQPLLFLLCLLACALRVAAQSSPIPFDTSRGKVVYSAVIAAPGVSQADLFGRALKWAATLPVSPNDPAVRDAGSGTIALRVGIPFIAQVPMLKMPCTLWREVSIQVKEGRAKYDISDFQCQLYAPTPGQTALPSKAQMKLTPLEDYLKRSDAQYYTKDGKPRVLTAGFLDATTQQSAQQIKTLTQALQAKSDF